LCLSYAEVIFASRSRPNYTTYELTRTCTWIRLGMDGDPGAGESLRELALEKLCTYCVGNVDNRQRGGIGEAYTRSGVYVPLPYRSTLYRGYTLPLCHRYRQSHTYERRAPKRRAPRGSGVHKGEGSREEVCACGLHLALRQGRRLYSPIARPGQALAAGRSRHLFARPRVRHPHWPLGGGC
jgi:hypothetical protein